MILRNEVTNAWWEKKKIVLIVIFILYICHRMEVLLFCFRTSNIQNILYKSNSYSFDYQKNSYFILRYTVVVQEGNIRKTMAARGLVNGRGPRCGRYLVFRCYPPELLSPPPKKKQKLTFWVSLFLFLELPGQDHHQTNQSDDQHCTCPESLYRAQCITEDMHTLHQTAEVPYRREERQE